jgi:hypothetical protein
MFFNARAGIHRIYKEKISLNIKINNKKQQYVKNTRSGKNNPIVKKALKN